MPKYQLGVMQGRLLPKYQGRYQAHPVGYWQEEFEIAKKLNLDLIEFILDYTEPEKNPLLNSGGPEEILHLIQKTGVKVKTICADYFMEAPFHSLDKKIFEKSSEVLIKLIEHAAKIGVTDIIIPCVDQSSFNNDPLLMDLFIKRISKALKHAEKLKINLSLETDLNPKFFLHLLHQFNSPSIKVNYDIGNSAALGYNCEEELSSYGNMISDIHIKDRVLGGKSVMLGTGEADFRKFFNILKNTNYQGPFIMQAFRDEEGVEVFKKQLNWIRTYL